MATLCCLAVADRYATNWDWDPFRKHSATAWKKKAMKWRDKTADKLVDPFRKAYDSSVKFMKKRKNAIVYEYLIRKIDPIYADQLRENRRIAEIKFE